MGRKSRARRLQTETLENRLVLAADVMSLLAPKGASAPEVAIKHVRQEAPPAAATLQGDFDGDGSIDAHDIDTLAAAIRSGAADAVFDLNSNGRVDKDDMNMLVHDILDTNYGDANLDRVVDMDDLRTWQEHAFQSDTGWSSGDFNGDGVTDVSDFNAWNAVRTSIPQLSAARSLTDQGETRQDVAAPLEVAESAEPRLEADQPQILSLIELPGDLNGDAVVDAADIDMLTHALRTGSEDPMFDLDNDGILDDQDTDFLIHDLLGTDFGDANLDGVVSQPDFELWQAYQFQQETGWATGDFNGDGVTDVSDFNVWNSHRAEFVDSVVLTEDILRAANGFEDPSTIAMLAYGDLNQDGAVNAADIDFMHAAIRVGLSDETLDLDGNGLVDMADSEMLLADVFGTVYGDANLDGLVDQLDREVWQSHNFQMATGWATGDFNGDGLTDVSDFNVWNIHRLPVNN